MSVKLLSYLPKKTVIHSLTGATKLLCFFIWSVMGMLTYDTRVLVFMFLFSLVLFHMSKIKFQEVKFIVYYMIFFLVLNDLALFAFSPYEGVKIYGTRTDILHLFGSVYITQEQLFYELNVTLKYLNIVPVAILFISATEPSEFAASLNRIGISYRIAYAVALTLRYIPDTQRDYRNIAVAQQARGIDISKNEKLFKRIKNAGAILVPLIFSSFERIEIISNAMALRRFGEHKKRTWYRYKPFTKKDYIALAFFVIMLVASLIITFYDGNRFYNPFI